MKKERKFLKTYSTAIALSTDSICVVSAEELLAWLFTMIAKANFLPDLVFT
jgi:hypothetical protein